MQLSCIVGLLLGVALFMAVVYSLCVVAAIADRRAGRE